MEKMTFQVANEKADFFEQSANDFFSDLNPARTHEGDFWTNFTFDRTNNEDELKVAVLVDMVEMGEIGS